MNQGEVSMRPSIIRDATVVWTIFMLGASNMPDAVPAYPKLILETPRLVLRPLSRDDAPEVYALYSDWEISQCLSRISWPFSVEAAHRFVADSEAALLDGLSYMLGMFKRDGGAFVGIVALRIPSFNPSYSEQERREDAGLGILGYSVARSYWNEGFATEAARGVITWAFDVLGLSRIQASPLRENVASQRVLSRLGFTVEEPGLLEEPLFGAPPRLADRYMLFRPPADE